MGCLNAATTQQQRTTRADQTLENQSLVQNRGAEELDEQFQKINFPRARADDQWEAQHSQIVLQLDRDEHNRSN